VTCIPYLPSSENAYSSRESTCHPEQGKEPAEKLANACNTVEERRFSAA
jgi:hypothetical protein